MPDRASKCPCRKLRTLEAFQKHHTGTCEFVVSEQRTNKLRVESGLRSGAQAWPGGVLTITITFYSQPAEETWGWGKEIYALV